METAKSRLFPNLAVSDCCNVKSNFKLWPLEKAKDKAEPADMPPMKFKSRTLKLMSQNIIFKLFINFLDL